MLEGIHHDVGAAGEKEELSAQRNASRGRGRTREKEREKKVNALKLRLDLLRRLADGLVNVVVLQEESLTLRRDRGMRERETRETERGNGREWEKRTHSDTDVSVELVRFVGRNVTHVDFRC